DAAERRANLEQIGADEIERLTAAERLVRALERADRGADAVCLSRACKVRAFEIGELAAPAAMRDCFADPRDVGCVARRPEQRVQLRRIALVVPEPAGIALVEEEHALASARRAEYCARFFTE